jgi:hypothetical protein
VIRLALTLTRAGGWPRLLLVAGCTAVVAALLLVVVAILRLPANPDETLFNVVAEPGLRIGTNLAAVLLTLPPLLLLDQAVRLGTASRERRLAALRLAGATPGEVRRLGALEVGVPALAGGVLGIGLYGVLRELLGGTPLGSRAVAGRLELVPTTVAPTWWQTLLVVAGVGAVGAVVGYWVSTRVVVTPLGVSRRQAQRRPRPWGLLMILGGIVLFSSGVLGDSPEVFIAVALGLLVVGMVSLVPWAAYWSGRVVQARAASVAPLLAARRLVTDPRPAGRAAAAVGGIALVSGGAVVVATDVVLHQTDSFYLVSVQLVVVSLAVALAVVVGSLAVHSTESLLDRKRSIAALVALGIPREEIVRSQRWEAGITALPVSFVGTALGTAALSRTWGFGSSPAFAETWPLVANLALTPALVWLAIVLATSMTHPWAVRAASPANLRTE